MAAAALVVVGLSTPAHAAGKLKVVATVGDRAAAAREVGGERVTVTSMARPKEDPHYVDAKPSYVRELSGADLLVLNGLSLEVGWLPALLDSARNGTIQEGNNGYFDASTVVQRMGVPDTAVTPLVFA
jgi:zinc/manganese transport system substrate-binding protein